MDKGSIFSKSFSYFCCRKSVFTGFGIIDMSYHFKKILTAPVRIMAVGGAILAASFLSPVKADVIDAEAVKEWQKKLAAVSTPEDSISVLYNLFDLTKRYDHGVFSEPLLSISERTMDYDVFLDVLRKVANGVANGNAKNVATLDSIMEIVKTVPANDNQQETLIFIEVRRLQTLLNSMNRDEKFDCLYQLVTDYQDDPSKPLYTRIRPLYLLTVALGKTVGGDIYLDYMNRLQLLINQLPDPFGPLTSLFYTQAAVSNTLNGERDKAVETNKQLLEIIDSLQYRNHSNGYQFVNYNNHRYVTLRRLLANYQMLTQDEIEKYYKELSQLVEVDADIAEEFHTGARSESYYLVANKKYNQAIPVLEKALANEKNAGYKLNLLRMLLESYGAVGASSKVADLRLDYINALEENLADQQQEKIMELQLLLDLTSDFRDQLVESETSYRNSLKHYRVALWIVSGFAAICMIWAIILSCKIRKRRQD